MGGFAAKYVWKDENTDTFSFVCVMMDVENISDDQKYEKE